MEDWTYTFGEVTKAEWLDQIRKDLNNRSIETIHSEWWPGETLDPFKHKEDMISGFVALPDRWFRQPPQIMEKIVTSAGDVKSIQRNIHNALLYGSQCLVFEMDKDSAPDFGVWYEGVNPDMIETCLIISPDFNVNAPWVPGQLPPNTYLRSERSPGESSANFLKSALTTQKTSNISFRFVYSFNSSGNWIEHVISIFQLIFNDLVEWNSRGKERIEFLNQCLLTIKPDASCFKQMIQTRVLQLLWLNVLDNFGPQKETNTSAVECHIQDDPSIDPDKYLVRAASSALAASLTGVHSIIIHYSDKSDVPAFYKRVNRNIHHLLNLESEMYKGVDPLAGAYTIDYYTRTWSEEIWKRLPGVKLV